MAYKVLFDKRALFEIEEAADYYASISKTNVKSFINDFNKVIKALEKNPFFQIRYQEIRCLPFKKYPFMAHYTLNEEQKTVYIHAVICTLRNPNTFWLD